MWLRFLPNTMAGPRLARRVAPLFGASVRHEKAPRDVIRIMGEHDGRAVRINLNLTWAYYWVEVQTQESRRLALYFRMVRDEDGRESYRRSQSDRNEAWDGMVGPDDHKFFLDDHVAMTWSHDSERLNARRLLDQLPPPLRHRMLGEVQGRTEWFFAFDKLELIRKAKMFSGRHPEKRIEGSVALCCDLLSAIENLAGRTDLLNGTPE